MCIAWAVFPLVFTTLVKWKSKSDHTWKKNMANWCKIWHSLRGWRDWRPSARALFMANGREREPRSREGIGASREGIGEESSWLAAAPLADRGFAAQAKNFILNYPITFLVITTLISFTVLWSFNLKKFLKGCIGGTRSQSAIMAPGGTYSPPWEPLYVVKFL